MHVAQPDVIDLGSDGKGLFPLVASYFAKAAASDPDESDVDVDEEGPATAAIRRRAEARHR